MTSQERQTLIAQYKDGYNEVTRSPAGFPADSLTAHPLAGKWSAAEIVHHLADSEPPWAGGDAARIRQLARAVTPPIARPALGLLRLMPGPVAAALRTGIDALINLVPKPSPA